jgi:hypothetical protein
MKFKHIILLTFLPFCGILLAQEERKVLVEVFTNSHCPLCPPAHNVVTNYLAGPNGGRISYIFYHMVYPYNDDPLYWASMEDSDARDIYYNAVNATPLGWIDGESGFAHSGWSEILDEQVNVSSPLKIILSGTRTQDSFNITSELTRTGDIPDNDLVIHFVVVEDLYFDGRNSVSDHKHVMRKMLPDANGQPFNINLNETITLPITINLDQQWDVDSLNVVVFVQSTDSKTVYQSATISYDELGVTDVINESIVPSAFKLEQNYPNPFNPSTIISYQLPVNSNVELKVFDLLGKEVATLVDEYKPAGEYEVEFNASSGIRNLVSGIYFYQLKVGSFIQTQKMILLK